MPSSGVPMLGNDRAGNCVWATFFHYLQLAELYVSGTLIQPTDQECLGAYAQGTGWDGVVGSPSDQGSIVAGPGGALEFWMKTGIVCAGQRNFLTSAVVVEHTDLDQLRLALTFGPVLCGALLRNDDAVSTFMWTAGTSPIDGGHEFLVVGHETLSSGKTYYDVITWNGLWRFSDDWALAQLDEAAMVIDPAFFGPSGLDPADVDLASVTAANQAIAAA
jgi:hypothetical protein